MPPIWSISFEAMSPPAKLASYSDRPSMSNAAFVACSDVARRVSVSIALSPSRAYSDAA